MRLDGLVSVITPSHNQQRYLTRVVESVAAQTVAVREHIIVDDGSTDGSRELLLELFREHPHLHVLFQDRRGAAAARNRGIAIARGRYIAFLDADDLWHPQKVERQVRFMEENGALFTFGDYVEVDHAHGRPQKRYHLPESVTHDDLLRGCPIGCLTAAYNQEELGKRYMPGVKSGHDWGLWLDLTRGGVRARKYPGLEASYTNGKASLSSRKFRKVKNVYLIYRENEELSRTGAVLRTIEHSLIAAAKKARLIYS